MTDPDNRPADEMGSVARSLLGNPNPPETGLDEQERENRSFVRTLFPTQKEIDQ